MAPEFQPGDFEEDDRLYDECLIDNPLRNLDPNSLLRRADAFARLVSERRPDAPLTRLIKRLARATGLSNGPLTTQTLEAESPDDVDEDLVHLFRRAAQVAQNPQKLDRLDLSRYEKSLLRHDREIKFWDQPKTLRTTIVTLCFSAIIQGWVQSSGNGANQGWPQAWDITNPDGSWSERTKNAKWIFGAINAMPYLSAGMTGCWLSDPLQSMFLGRRGAIFASGLVCFASLIGSACARNWQQLLVCRALVGVGLGSKASVTPIFGAETSPSHLRGALVMNWQLFDAFGIFLGFSANLVLLKTGDNLSWRLQFASACLPTLFLFALILTIPESPRWLLKQRRHRDAFKALCLLRETPLQAAVELFYANAQLQIEARMQPKGVRDLEKSPEAPAVQHIEDANEYKELNKFQDSFAMTNYFSRILQLFRDDRTRRATIAAAVVMLSQQLSGINVIAFYSSTLFRDTVLDTKGQSDGDLERLYRQREVRALWLSWGVGLANFVFTFPAYYLIDTKGRRFPLLCTYPAMTLSMLAACLSFISSPSAQAPNDTVLEVKVFVFLFIFVFFYAWGPGPVAFAYSSEVFPLINREAGMSFAVFVNLMGAGILTLFVPLFQKTQHDTDQHKYNVGQAQLLGSFVGFNVLAMILNFFLVPETAGATIRKRQEEDHLSYLRLEELNYIFGVSTMKHVSYQVRHVVPFAFTTIRWWLCRRFTTRWKEPVAPTKMWVWVEMQDQQPKMQQDVDTSQSSGLDRGVEDSKEVGLSRVSQRNVVQLSKPD